MTSASISLVRFEQPGVGFEPVTHRYTDHGEPVVNVTSVLKAHKISADWSAIDPITLEQKRALGHAVHAATHYLDEGDLDASSVAPPLVPYLAAWTLAKAALDLEILLVETRLVHPLKRYGGTVDRVGIAHALQPRHWGHLRPAIVDLKTGHPEDAGAGPQTAAYEDLIRTVLSPAILGRPDLEAGWGDPWPRYSVQLLPTGQYTLFPYTKPRDGHRFTWALSLEASAHSSWAR